MVYTYLYSKYSSTNGNGSQELHYLGIPLNAVYRFARIKRLSFYAAAGGQVEPYMAYYFENKSEIHNIWKDKPFNFGLTFGIRTGF